MRAVLACLLFVVSVGVSRADLCDVKTLVRLKSKILQKNREFQLAQSVADQADVTLASYGGTDRELTELVEKMKRKLGSIEAVERWIDSQSEIGLAKWHRLNSDLDIMLIPNEGGKSSPSSYRLNELKALQRELTTRLPGSTFYRKLDTNITWEFFNKYPLNSNHYEPISNEATSLKGLERIEDFLTVDVPGHGTHNMSERGAEQMAKQDFRFVRNPRLTTAPDEASVMRDLESVFRWVRYYSQFPNSKRDAQSTADMKALLHDTVTANESLVHAILQRGDRDLIGKTDPVSDEEKLIDLLEKAQLYTTNSERTSELFEELGISDLMRKSEIAERRLLKPIRSRKSPPPADAPRLGKTVVTEHYGPIQAIQSMGAGSIWVSDGESYIKGKRTSDSAGERGIYTQDGRQVTSHTGAYAVKITLSPDAVVSTPEHPVENADVWTDHNGVYIIKTLNAIARDERGNLMISEIDESSLLSYHASALVNEPNAKISDRLDHIEGLADLTNPESNAEHRKLVEDILPKLSNYERQRYWESFAQNPIRARHFLVQPRGNDVFTANYFRLLESDDEAGRNVAIEIARNPEIYPREVFEEYMKKYNSEFARFAKTSFLKSHPNYLKTIVSVAAQAGDAQSLHVIKQRKLQSVVDQDQHGNFDAAVNTVTEKVSESSVPNFRELNRLVLINEDEAKLMDLIPKFNGEISKFRREGNGMGPYSRKLRGDWFGTRSQDMQNVFRKHPKFFEKVALTFAQNGFPSFASEMLDWAETQNFFGEEHGAKAQEIISLGVARAAEEGNLNEMKQVYENQKYRGEVSDWVGAFRHGLASAATKASYREVSNFVSDTSFCDQLPELAQDILVARRQVKMNLAKTDPDAAITTLMVDYNTSRAARDDSAVVEEDVDALLEARNHLPLDRRDHFLDMSQYAERLAQHPRILHAIESDRRALSDREATPASGTRVPCRGRLITGLN